MAAATVTSTARFASTYSAVPRIVAVRKPRATTTRPMFSTAPVAASAMSSWLLTMYLPIVACPAVVPAGGKREAGIAWAPTSYRT